MKDNLNSNADAGQDAPPDAKHLLPAVPSHEVVMAEIYKWADEIKLPSGYDEDLNNLYKKLSVFWHSN
jgi:hypothetical protein